MKILIVGATGKTGQKLLKHLSSSAHHESTGLIRNEVQKNLITPFKSNFIIGDLEENLDQLSKEFDAIMFVAGSGGRNVESVDYQGVVKIVDYALQANIKRLLYLSSINIGKSKEQFIEEIKTYYRLCKTTAPEGLLTMAEKPGYQNYLAMKALAEKKIVESGINYSIFRAGLLTEDDGSNQVNATLGMLNAFGKISRNNVAQCFVEALENPNTYQKTYTIIDGSTLIRDAF